MVKLIKEQVVELEEYSKKGPSIKAKIVIGDSQIWITALDDKGRDAGTVMLENYNGAIWSRTWRWHDEGNDPYKSIIVRSTCVRGGK